MKHYATVLAMVLLMMALDVAFLRYVSSADMLVLPESGKAPLLQVLALARRSIWVVAYRLTDDKVIDQLCQASRRGVHVRVLLNRSTENETAERILREAGAATAWGSARYRRTHQKTIIIDSQVAWVLTFNLTPAVFRSARGFGVPVTDTRSIRIIETVFDADWSGRTVSNPHPDLVWVPGPVREQVQTLLDDTRQRLDVYNEHMDDRRMEDALIAARGRGVSVRVLMSPDDGNQPGRNRLTLGGVQVRLVTKPFIHAKMFLMDRAAVVGSINISEASLERNRELSVVVRHSGTLKRLATVFDTDWSTAVQTPCDGVAPAGPPEEGPGPGRTRR